MKYSGSFHTGAVQGAQYESDNLRGLYSSSDRAKVYVVTGKTRTTIKSAIVYQNYTILT